MLVAGMEKITLLDYPEKLACIIFTQGCNFKCPFCQNSDLIKCNQKGNISEEEVFEYLNKRKNVLDGVVITGGEPTIQKDLKEFIKKVKELGLLVKLDTNGFRPDILEDLINDNLIDYVAMDIKNSLEKYSETSGIKNINTQNILKSIAIIKMSNINHEFRTTIIKEHHDNKDIENILKIIGHNSKYYLQNFKNSEYVLDKSLHGFSDEELKEMQEYFRDEWKNVIIRGL